MSRSQTSKVLLHAVASEGKLVHRWVVAVFVNKVDAGMFAGLLKQAHASGDAERITALDPRTPKTADGSALTGLKLSAETVPYSPHKTAGSGLDED